MTSQSHPSPPDPWAQSRRIAAEWREMGRGVDRRTQVARMESVRAARAKAVAETRETRRREALEEAIAKGIAEALKDLPRAAASLFETAPDVPVAPAVPEKALHEMTTEEWDARRQAYWGDRLPNHSRPITIGDLVTGQHGGHEA
ncbi:hypothetical protein ACFTY8_19475 [Streptomyces mirabilis]|uniref:hypothetical protein n=1 Tax=Streptomyces mirabilis TaxID=68239 RepID=UPI00363D8B29